MNIWCLRPVEQFGFGLIEEFLKDKNLKIKLLTVNNDFHQNLLKKKLTIDGIEIKEAKYLNIDFKVNYIEDSFTLTNYSNLIFQKYKNISLNLLSRNERFNSEISNEERERYIFKQYIYWSNKFKSNGKLNLIIFFDIPHMYYEYIIIGLAKLLKIPVIILKHNTRNTFFFNEDLKPIKNLKNSLNFNDFFQKLNFEKNRSYEEKKNSSTLMINIFIFLRFLFLSIPKSFIFKFKRKYKEISSFIKFDYYTFKNNIDLNEKIHNLKYSYKCIERYLEYQRISSKKIPKKFIYLPLVSNQEADLYPGCWPWNLEKVIEYLLLKFEKTDYQICIKEHPRQFKMRYHQNFNRHKNFYKNYLKNKKITFISLDIKNEDLIEKSAAIVCSSLSSSALDGLKLNKKVIYFGPNILNSKNCIKLESFTSLDEILSHSKNDEKIYYPYKQYLDYKSFNLISQDFERLMDKKDLIEIKENIFEYYKNYSDQNNDL